MQSVLGTEYPNFEVLFVDNASTDGSVDFIRKSFAEYRVRIIRNPGNLGAGAGYNVGMRASKGEYIVQLNNDILVDPSWLGELVDFMEENPKVGIAGCKFLVYGEKKLIDSVGYKIDVYGVGVSVGHREKDLGQYDEIRYDFDFLLGAGVIYRRKLLDKVGLHDSGYFMYYEEPDISVRTRCAGFEIAYVPSAVVWHKHEATAEKVDPSGSLRYYRLRRSQFRYMIKNWDICRLFSGFTLNIFREGGLFITSVIKFKPQLHFLRPFLWNLLNFRSTWKKRLEVKQLCASWNRVGLA
jgi:GT2 family glycosyltransferase